MKYLVILRPKQWVKNLFVFAALIFSQNLFEPQLFGKTLLAFILFCCAASGIYILNDIMDREQDRNHPTKKDRPIASGEIGHKPAFLVSFILVVAALVGSIYLGFWFELTLFAYLANNVLYSLYFKHVVLIDVFMIAFGFVLRVVGGATAINVEISSWLVICTILLSLFLAFSKRRHELVILNDQAEAHRAILKEYSPYFLDQMIGVVTASTVVAYSLYTMSEEVISKFGNLQLTIPFVLYGIFRYLYLVHQKAKGGSPTKVLFTDIPILVTVALWACTVIFIIYL